MKILVTGFMPFNGAAVNPSWEAVQLLPESIGGAQIIRRLLPVEYETAGRMVVQEARETGASLVICTGVAGGRTSVTPELLAVNWRMASIADNAGKLCTGEKIAPNAPDAVMTVLPVTDMAAKAKAQGLACSVSLSAGAYVCNDVYWYALQGQADNGYKALFVHVPLLEQSPAEDTARVLKTCIETALDAIRPV